MFTNWWGLSIMQLFTEMFPGVPGVGKVALAAWLLWVILSITFHELGHGFAAIRCGDDTPRLTGHMTLDPVRHMGTLSFVMLAVVGIAWGMMPVNPSNFRRRHDDALVALAGPLVNVALVALCLAGAVAARLLMSGNAEIYVFVVCFIGLQLNIVLAIFNLMPIPPLDGSRILASYVPSLRAVIYTPQAAVVGLILMLTVGSAMIAPIIGLAMRAAIEVLHLFSRP